MLSLAHMYSNPKYARFFNEQHRRGRYIIMDNSAYELPKPYTIEELWELVVMYGASELVLPDVLKEQEATGVATRDALIDLIGLASQHQIRRYLKQVMIVPQGKEMFEWVVSLEELLSAVDTYVPYLHVTVGIAKHTNSFPGGRLKILDYLLNKYNEPHRFHNIHMLGISENPTVLREISLAFGSKVRSIDSARPGVYAAANIICKYGVELPYTPRPKNYFELDLTKIVTNYSWRLRNNIGFYDWITKDEGELSWQQIKYSF